MNKKSIVLNAVYEEFQPSTYLGIDVLGESCRYECINTGNFEADLRKATEKYRSLGYTVYKSSTVDNYRMDVKRVAGAGITKATINADWLAEQVAGIVYNQSKAKILNVLESQLPINNGSDMQKLRACSEITVDIIGNIARNVSDFLRSVLGDWEQECEFGGELSPKELTEAQREHAEIQSMLNR